MWEPKKRPVYAEPAPFVNACEDCAEPLDAPHADRCPRRAAYETVGKSDVGLSDLAIVLDGDRAMNPIAEVVQVVRDDTNAHLATTAHDLPLITHGQMGELYESFASTWTAAGAKICFETAGSLRGGKNVWGLIRLDEPFTITGDDSATFPYAVMLNDHTGKGACKFSFTNVRVVCWNTYQAADVLGEGHGFEIVIRHTGNTEAKIEEAKQALTAMRSNAEAYRTVCEELQRIKLTDEMVSDFSDWFIPMPDGATERMRNSRNTKRAQFVDQFSSALTAIDEPNGYGLLQTTGEWLDHARRANTRDSYLARTVLKSEPTKFAAVQKIREMATAS
jgi:phage/plasmid-like protein (TIGR03299 family)